MDLSGPQHTRSNPPSNCKPDQWVDLIDNVWTSEKFMRKSEINSRNRAKSEINHSCGSKSLPIRAFEKIEKNGGELGFFPDFFKETHYNPKKKKWATPRCEIVHANMQKDAEEHASQTDAIPLTPEELSRKHLGHRSGIIQGLGMRPSSSLRTTATSSQGSHPDVVRLEAQLQQRDAQHQQLEAQQHQLLAELKQRDDQLDAQRLVIEEQQKKTDSMMEFMRQMGYKEPPPPPSDG